MTSKHSNAIYIPANENRRDPELARDIVCGLWLCVFVASLIFFLPDIIGVLEVLL